MIEKEDIVRDNTDHTDRTGHERPHNIKQQIPPAVADSDEEWVKEYIEQFGDSPSFF